MSVSLIHRPRTITIDRAAAMLDITWADGYVSRYPLTWLRANCPCATCREQRRAAQVESDLLTLSSSPPPSTEVANAELVGHYAVRLVWTDGHDSGIYAYAELRHTAELAGGDPAALPPLLD